MKKQSIFDGDSYFSQFANLAYRMLMGRGWITNLDIMNEYVRQKNPSGLPCPVSKSDHVKELTKALSALKKEIGMDKIEVEGNNRNRRIRYVGTDNDPLADMRNARVVRDLRQYCRFCQDSEGFFPSSWLEYFFKDCKDLIDIKRKRKKGEQILSASLDRKLNNIELLPLLYESIIGKQVLDVTYRPFYEKEVSLTFHPHFLKEFNGRWYVLGHAEGRSPEYGYIVALDRICSRPRERANVNYKAAPAGYYKRYFEDIVGVTHLEDEGQPRYKAQPIYIRAHSRYMYMLTETKMVHPSQKVSVPFDEDRGYGEFVVNVELNNEFIGRIMQMGDELEVVAPEDVREVFKERAAKLADRYK